MLICRNHGGRVYDLLCLYLYCELLTCVMIRKGFVKATQANEFNFLGSYSSFSEIICFK